MSGPKFQRGDVVWFLMHHPGGQGTSKRRGLVIGDPLDNTNGDYILMQITTGPWTGRTDFVLQDTDPEFSATGLDTTSTFRGHKLFVVPNDCVQRKAGALGPNSLKEVEQRVRIALRL